MNQLLSGIMSEFDDRKRFACAAIVGSEARHEASLYSDLDLVFYSYKELKDDHQRYQLTYREDRLISISIKSLASARDAFTKPLEVIATIQGLRDSMILRDSSDHDLAKLKTAAEEFDWTPELKEAANIEASYQLMGNAEEVHKVLNGLAENNDLKLLNGAWGLAMSMPMVIALRHNVLSAGDNLFRDQVCKSVGLDSPWTKFHAISIGSCPGPSGYSQLAQQAIGGFWLFEETARLIKEILVPGDAAVIDGALRTAHRSKLFPASFK